MASSVTLPIQGRRYFIIQRVISAFSVGTRPALVHWVISALTHTLRHHPIMHHTMGTITVIATTAVKEEEEEEGNGIIKIMHPSIIGQVVAHHIQGLNDVQPQEVVPS